MTNITEDIKITSDVEPSHHPTAAEPAGISELAVVLLNAVQNIIPYSFT